MATQPNPLDRIVLFGGEPMPYGEMVRQLQELAGGNQAMVDRYLQGFEKQEKENE